MYKYRGKFIDLMERNNWEFVDRPGATGLVAIIPVTDDDKIILIKQYREPFKKYVIEVPAGIVGDKDKKESIFDAAKRELFEETGYEADSLVEIGSFCVSPGMSTELLTYVLATGLKKTGEGGGEDSEQIEVFDLPIASAVGQLTQMAKEEKVIVDAKIFSAILFAYPVCAKRLRDKMAKLK